MEEENNNLNTSALFLGTKAENAGIFEKLILDAFRDHVFWRRNFHPEDPMFLSQNDKRSYGYEETVDSFKSKFYELISRLKKSVPFYSPRYLGHMTADILMPAIVGYFSTMLYNPNNVCYEASPVTSELEIEVGRDLAHLMGFYSQKSWAHLTSGGTVANIEALWVIRNIKYFPLVAKGIIKKYKKEFFIELPNGEKKDITKIDSDYTLLSLSPESLSCFTEDFFSRNWGFDIQEEVFKHKRNISHSGMYNVSSGKILISATKHYSWSKAVEILGIGRSNIECIKVDSNFRMDVDDLKQKLLKLSQNNIPVLGVVSILGSTECGSIDPVDKVVNIRKWYEKECSSSFFIHIDGAYGGYPRSIFIDEDNKTFRDQKEIQEEFKCSQHINWPYEEVYNAYKAISEVDSVTVDPHKFGYIPYPAGALIFRDKRVKPATLCKAPYINNSTKADDEDTYIGGYILEGSKPGAAAAACWLSHKIIPLNKQGYGKIISDPIKNAHIVHDLLNQSSPLVIQKGDKQVNINIEILNMPDLDILLYIFNIEGNSSLEKMNKLNELILEEHSYSSSKVVAAHEFVISSTELYYDEYESSVNQKLQKLGINLDDWNTYTKSLTVLRTSVVTPLVNKEETRSFYWSRFINSICSSVEKIVLKEDF